MNRCVRAVVLVVLLMGSPGPQVNGQVDGMIFQQKAPQAQTREELYAFLDLVDNAGSKRLLPLSNQFLERFSESEFRAFIHRMRMNSYRDMNEYQSAVQAGKRALELNPQDIDVLLGVANLLPNQSAAPSNDLLSSAEGYAQRALEEIISLKAPHSLSLETWGKTVSAMKASAHCALGVIALKRHRYSDSVAELEICAMQNPKAAGPELYLLGVALIADRKSERAAAVLRRAAGVGPDSVRVQAEEQLRLLEGK